MERPKKRSSRKSNSPVVPSHRHSIKRSKKKKSSSKHRHTRTSSEELGDYSRLDHKKKKKHSRRHHRHRHLSSSREIVTGNEGRSRSTSQRRQFDNYVYYSRSGSKHDFHTTSQSMVRRHDEDSPSRSSYELDEESFHRRHSGSRGSSEVEYTHNEKKEKGDGKYYRSEEIFNEPVEDDIKREESDGGKPSNASSDLLLSGKKLKGVVEDNKCSSLSRTSATSSRKYSEINAGENMLVSGELILFDEDEERDGVAIESSLKKRRSILNIQNNEKEGRKELEEDDSVYVNTKQGGVSPTLGSAVLGGSAYRHRIRDTREEDEDLPAEKNDEEFSLYQVEEKKMNEDIIIPDVSSKHLGIDKVFHKFAEQRRDRLQRFEALAAASKLELRSEVNKSCTFLQVSSTLLPLSSSSDNIDYTKNSNLNKMSSEKSSSGCVSSRVCTSKNDALSFIVAEGSVATSSTQKASESSANPSVSFSSSALSSYNNYAADSTGNNSTYNNALNSVNGTVKKRFDSAIELPNVSSTAASSCVEKNQTVSTQVNQSPSELQKGEKPLNKTSRLERFRAFAAQKSVALSSNSDAATSVNNLLKNSCEKSNVNHSKVVLKLSSSTYSSSSSPISSSVRPEVFVDSNFDTEIFSQEKNELEKTDASLKSFEDVDSLEEFMSQLKESVCENEKETDSKPLFLSAPKTITMEEIHSWSLHKYKWENISPSSMALNSSTSDGSSQSFSPSVKGELTEKNDQNILSVSSKLRQTETSEDENIQNIVKDTKNNPGDVNDDDEYYKQFIECMGKSTFKSSKENGEAGDTFFSQTIEKMSEEKNHQRMFTEEAIEENKFFSPADLREKIELIENFETKNEESKKKNFSRNEEEKHTVFGDIEDDIRIFSDDETVEERKVDNNSETYFDLLKKVGQKKELPPVDHSKIEYKPFRKNLYVQVREITLMKDHEVEVFRKTNGNIKIRGKNCPRPVKSFSQCGLPEKIMKLLQKREYEEPFPIQKQAIPALMSGRDIIGIAETGSGKTLAYILPMLRHILDQSSLKDGDGPIGLVIAPTRELVVQIQQEMKKFCKTVDLTCIAVYGGTGIGEQLGSLRRGGEIVVGTPGRLIDVLTISNGKVTNLRRVSFVVLDEADRMFDMGFEPQVGAIVRNVQPSRQTCLFSATFPPHIEALARKILYKPLEIVIGERGRTASRVKQFVEIRSEYEKFFRLLQLLGEWHEYGSIIIFVSRQVEADDIFVELFKYGYQCAVLHGGQDQTDREFTLQDFKDGQKTILIATSIAARGLDVKSVVLVINYKVPDHIEDYVHRIGRTGRAGNVGVAYTFLSPQEADKAEELVKALKVSEQDVPTELQELADEYKVKCNMGIAKARRGKGFGGKGFKFVASEKSRLQQERQAAKIELGMDDEEEDEDEITAEKVDDLRTTDDDVANLKLLSSLQSADSGVVSNSSDTVSDTVSGAAARAKALAQFLKKGEGNIENVTERLIDQHAEVLAQKASSNIKDPEQRARLVALAKLTYKEQLMMKPRSTYLNPISEGGTQMGVPGILTNVAPPTLGKVKGLSANGYIDPITGNAVDELDINDYPQHARFKITHREVLSRISDISGAVCQIKGQYVSPEQARNAPHGLKRLYVEIIGSTPILVQRARHELHLLMETVSMKQLNLSNSQKGVLGKYSVL